MNRDHVLADMTKQEFDLVIVGGGITGAMLAYDAAHRGMSVALIEKGDFGAATSAASSKVLHGGIRFLRQLRLDKVRESSLERMRIRNLVPHLCADVPFVIPTYRKLGNDKITLSIARLVYDIVTAGQNSLLNDGVNPVARSSVIGQAELFDRARWLTGQDDITGGLLLPEIHMKSSERVTWSMIDASREQGSKVANYARAEKLIRNAHRVTGVRVVDELSGSSFDVRGRTVANCAGPWIESLGKSYVGDNTITAFCRGAHLVVQLEQHDCAVALPTSQKIEGMSGVRGRNMFLIPWRGRTLVGTSYSRHDSGPDSVEPSIGDISQLLHGINNAVGQNLITPDNIAFSYAGLYPLTTINVDTDRYQGATDYRLIDHAKVDGVDGYISVFGAKFTTSRRLAEKAADIVAKKAGRKFRNCQTRSVKSIEIEGHPSNDLIDILTRGANSDRVDVVSATAKFFGPRAREVLNIAVDRPELAATLGCDRELIASAAVYCAKNELVEHLDDFVFRRTGLGTAGHPGDDTLQLSARLIGDELGWTEARRREEISRVDKYFPDVALYADAAAYGKGR